MSESSAEPSSIPGSSLSRPVDSRRRAANAAVWNSTRAARYRDDSGWASADGPLVSALVQMLSGPRGSETLIDVGGGTGDFSACAVQRAGWAKATVIDPSQDMLDQVRDHGLGSRELTTLRGTAEDLPALIGRELAPRADVAAYLHTLDYVNDVEAAIQAGLEVADRLLLSNFAVDADALSAMRQYRETAAPDTRRHFVLGELPQIVECLGLSIEAHAIHLVQDSYAHRVPQTERTAVRSALEQIPAYLQQRYGLDLDNHVFQRRPIEALVVARK